MTRLSIIIVATACALALPAAALAQSAGDNQYQDPLANPHTGSNSGSKGSSGSGSSTPAAPSQGTSSGSGSSTSGTSGSSGAATASSSGSSTASSLPRTGGHPELIALAGLVLLAGGLVFRRAGRPTTDLADFDAVYQRFK